MRKIIAFIAAKIQSENAPKDSILWTQLRTVFNMKVALEYRIKDDDAPDLTTTILNVQIDDFSEAKAKLFFQQSAIWTLQPNSAVG